jgi:hydroxymethylpyrimidine pyrophosphatase-like HAD family hydrolase
MTKRIIAVDLDGTLAEYHGWKGVTHIGKAVPSIVSALKQAQELGAEIWIFTARVSDDESSQASFYINDWLKQHGIEVAGITATKHKFFTEFWDDRAIQVVRNTGEMVMHPEYEQAQDMHGVGTKEVLAESIKFLERYDNDCNVGKTGPIFTPADDLIDPLDVQEGGNHYKKYPIQPIEFCHANKIPSLESSIIKYVVRHKDKHGLEDLKKAKHILDILIKLEYNK